jgi:hypothetical protein
LLAIVGLFRQQNEKKGFWCDPIQSSEKRLTDPSLYGFSTEFALEWNGGDRVTPNRQAIQSRNQVD